MIHYDSSEYGMLKLLFEIIHDDIKKFLIKLFIN
jgi:hypothetical protein